MEDNNNFQNQENRENRDESIYTNRTDNREKHSYTYSVEGKKAPKKRRGLFSYIVVALIAALIGGTLSSYIAPNYLYGRYIPTPKIFKGSNNVQKINIDPKDDITTVEAVAKKSMKSVVGITTVQVKQNFFFGPIREQGVGSGVIVDSDGYIMTNSHVIGNSKKSEITVLFENGDKKKGEVLWYDTSLDLAMVKVDGTNLPAAELGNSDDVNVGEIAVAIGNPLGLDFERTVTSGIISGLNRTLETEGKRIEDLLQTDASINPGNSGGPLLNSKGEVIGINTVKIRSEVAEGLGFAIPINTAKPIISQVIEKGEFNPVILGIQGISVENYEQMLGRDLSPESGVYIVEVYPDTPAAEVGLRVGDVIIKIDDKETETIDDIRKVLFNYNIGDKSNITILRNGEEKTVGVTFDKKSGQ